MKRSLRSWLWRVPLEQEVDEEVAFHLEMRTRELIAQGMDPAAARETALARAGDLELLRRSCIDLGGKRDREMRLTERFEEIRDDVKFALRHLKASPAFTAVAVLTLALGIGANSAIFALADRVLLRPLPFPNADRLVAPFERFNTFERASVAPLNLRDWDERNRTFEDMAGLSFGGSARAIIGPDGLAEQVTGFRVTVNFFDVLGVTPIAGRTFVASDAKPSPDVVVLSEAFWQSRFGGDRSAVGRAMQIDSRPFTVIGVVPDESQALGSSSLWTPYVSPPGVDERAMHYMRAVGRLKPGVALEAAREDLGAIADDLAREHPATNKGRGVTIDPLREVLISDEVGLTSWLLVGVVGFVLLMCCANVANLLLSRTTARGRELAVRAAIGAGRRRIVAQVVTESLVLAAIGGLAGLAVGAAIVRAAPALIPPGLLNATVAVAFDGRVVLFSAAITLIVGILFGIAPALQATGISFVQLLTAQGRSTGRGGRIRSWLAGLEVATAVLLLCGAGLLLRTLIAVERVDGGFGADNMLTMQVTLPGGVPGARYATREESRQFYESVEREVARLPGIRSVAWGRSLPLDHGFNGELSLEIVGDPPLELTSRPLTDYQTVSAAYFRTLDIPVVRGRGFDESDAAGSVPVCIVNEAFVRRYLNRREPIGKRIRIRRLAAAPGPPVEREIVGVVQQVRGRPDEREEPVHVYVPIAQDSWVLASLVVQPVAGPAEALTPAVRAAIARVDKDVPVAQIRTLDDIARQATARQRFRAVLVVAFGAVALVLAMVGVFGVLAYSVQQRRREFGVRMALGASRPEVMRLVLSGAARLVAVGAVVGLSLAAMLGQSISAFLIGVRPIDPATFAGVIAVVGVTAAVATAAPVFRATRVDPAVTFRGE